MTLLAAAPRFRDPVALIQTQLTGYVNSFFRLLPNLVAALIVVVALWLVSRLAKRLVARAFLARGRHDLGELIGNLVSLMIKILALLIASVIVFPSISPADLLSTLGIGSVAIGFAFKDILQNMLAGLLLLIRRPFRRGDQIAVEGHEGTVEAIESRATLLKTYDGRRVVIPNATIYSSAVTVNTAFEARRTDVAVGIGYGDDLPGAMAAFAEAIRGVEGVEAEPAPIVYATALAGSSVDLAARFWTGPRQADVTLTRGRVIEAIYKEAKSRGIDLPFPTQVVLFHDQTEDVDGDPARQREGWPARPGVGPRARPGAPGG